MRAFFRQATHTFWDSSLLEGVYRTVYVVNTTETRMRVSSMLGKGRHQMLVALCGLVLVARQSGAGEAHHHPSYY